MTPPPSAADNYPHDLKMMTRALELARQAAALGEIPIGAVVTRGDQILAEAHNLRETTHDPTAHAERLALTRAGQEFGSWHLDGCDLYVTLEPCPMCAGAIVLARIRRVIYAVPDWKAGSCRSLYRLTDDSRLNHQVETFSGVLAEDCEELLSNFFVNRRRLSTR